MTRTKLPEEGRPWDLVRTDLAQASTGDHAWREGRLPLYIYYRDKALLDAQCEAFSMYMVENGHGANTVFPSLKRFETEVIGMALDLFHAPADATGSFTSGGTESILLAVKSFADRARAKDPARRYNLVIPHSAHPAFNKAGQFMQLDVRRTRIDEDGRADVSALEAAIDEDTILLVGSAPAYPHGVFDRLSEIGALAQRRGVPLHVDACFGGFLSPFARALGYPIPDFDFAIPGVTSLSADIHKYGFAPKGASVVLYRDPAMMDFQTFEFDDWPRGLYRSTTFAGSKPGGALAGAWAMMRHLGHSGYRMLADETMRAKTRLVEGIGEIDGLHVFAPGELSIFSYASVDPALDIDGLAAAMTERGWFVSRTSAPKGVHFTVNPVHLAACEQYLADLRELAGDVRKTGRKGVFVASTY